MVALGPTEQVAEPERLRPTDRVAGGVSGSPAEHLRPDVPAPDLARFLARNHAELVGLAASLPERAEAAPGIGGCRRAVRPDDPLPIMVGGDLAHDAALMTSLDVAWAGTSLTAAAPYAAALLEPLADRPAAEVPELP